MVDRGSDIFNYTETARIWHFPKKQDLIPLAIVGITSNRYWKRICCFFGEQWLPSGLTALLVTTAPFWMVGMESILPNGNERPINSCRIVIGVVGVALIFGGDIKHLFDGQLSWRSNRYDDCSFWLVGRDGLF